IPARLISKIELEATIPVSGSSAVWGPIGIETKGAKPPQSARFKTGVPSARNANSDHGGLACEITGNDVLGGEYVSHFSVATITADALLGANSSVPARREVLS